MFLGGATLLPLLFTSSPTPASVFLSSTVKCFIYYRAAIFTHEQFHDTCLTVAQQIVSCFLLQCFNILAILPQGNTLD